MSETQGQRVAKLLAYIYGDMRDWPKLCPLCGGNDLVTLFGGYPDVMRCGSCGLDVTEEVLLEDRVRRAQRELGLLR